LKDSPTSDYYHEYRVALSPSPKSNSALDAVSIGIGYSNGNINGKLYHRDLWDGFSAWFYIDEIEVWLDENWLTFKIPIVSLPCSVSGRYLSVDSYWGYNDWGLEDADLNRTHLQIGQTGSISGEVVFAGHRGGPIFVRAFTDLRNPDESLVAYTVLDEPGAFLLENVGLGLHCYIEAFSPLFGDYHPFDMSALKSTTNQLVFTKSQMVSGIVLSLDVPIVLHNGIWQSGKIDFPLKREQYFAFDAISGADYILELERFGMSNAYMTILDRNGNDELMQGFSWQLEPIYWTCLVNGRYYVRISEPEWSTESDEFSVRMTTTLECPDVDISGSQWTGVRDCRVDFNDFALLASYWMQDCSEPYWCEDSDYTQSGTVNIADLSELLDDWLMDGLLNNQPE